MIVKTCFSSSCYECNHKCHTVTLFLVQTVLTAITEWTALTSAVIVRTVTSVTEPRATVPLAVNLGMNHQTAGTVSAYGV